MMKLILTALVATAAVATAHAETDARYYNIQPGTVRELNQMQIANLNELKTDSPVGIGAAECSNSLNGSSTEQGGLGDVLNPINTIDVIVDKIINIGKKLWTVVQAGKPVLNLKTDIATALPMGTRCWTDLQAWQMPESKVYEVSFKNDFGMEVVKMAYRILWVHGGQFNGQGSYIGYATMMPVDVKVAWGFQMNANVTIPTVFNMGTREAPVAGMQMNMQYRIETPFKTVEQGQAYVIDGRGQFKAL